MKLFSIVIPCLDEIESIDFVLSRLMVLRDRLLTHRLVDQVEIIVVDDGSTDGSTEKLRAVTGIRLLRHETPRGYGCSLKEGFARARGDWLACFDMDATYDPIDLADCLAALQRDDHDIVIGVRPFWSSGMPVVRSVGNHLFSTMVRWRFGQGVPDIACGLRAFQRRRLPEIVGLIEDDFQFGFSFTTWALAARWRIASIPIHYGERRGESKLQPLRDGLGFLKVWVNYGFRARRPVRDRRFHAHDATLEEYASVQDGSDG